MALLGILVIVLGLTPDEFLSTTRYIEGLFADQPLWEGGNGIVYDTHGGTIRLQSHDFDSTIEQRKALKNEANADDI